jgi:heme-degrading monooxygenase HmoA
MAQLCTWATVHWVRFERPRTAAELAAASPPAGCVSWKFGLDEAASPVAGRSASEVWCGVALFAAPDAAEAALEDPQAHVPSLPEATESWHALLRPIAHHGACNLLDPASPGALFEPHPHDQGGPLLVMTSAGFDLRAKSDFARLIDFRRRVNAMRSVIAQAPGSMAHQVFATPDAGDDALTLSLWTDDAAMAAFAYRAGAHRTELDRQKSQQTVDRSSFTRFRIERAAGTWNGRSLP